MTQKIKLALDLIKARFIDRGVVLFWATFIGILVASRGLPNPLTLLKALVVSFSIVTAVYVYNDVMDYEYDKLNKIDRPVARGELSRKEGLIIALTFAAIGVFMGGFINSETLILTLIFLTLGFLYSTPPVRLKKRFLMKQIITSTGTMICCLIGGTVVGNLSIQVIYLGFIYFLLLMAGSPLADLADLRGDTANGVKSLTVAFGPKFAIKFAMAVFFTTIVATVISYPYIGFNVLTPMIVTGCGLGFIWVTYGFLRVGWQDPIFCKKNVRKLIAINFIYQFSFVLGVL